MRGYVHIKELEYKVMNKLNSLGINESDYPINPYKIASDEGIILQEIDFENEDIKGMIMYVDDKAGIAINKNRSFVSRRFTAMHELAHYWFHPHKNHILCLDSYLDEKHMYEWQANNAAAIALMPRNLFMSVFIKFNGNKDEICNFFKVSSQQFEYRFNTIFNNITDEPLITINV